MHDERLWASDVDTTARRVVQVHQEGQCYRCTTEGCPTLQWALEHLSRQSPGPDATGGS